MIDTPNTSTTSSVVKRSYENTLRFDRRFFLMDSLARQLKVNSFELINSWVMYIVLYDSSALDELLSRERNSRALFDLWREHEGKSVTGEFIELLVNNTGGYHSIVDMCCTPLVDQTCAITVISNTTLH